MKKNIIIFITLFVIGSSSIFAQVVKGRPASYAPVVKNGNEWTLNGVNWTAEDKRELLSLLNKIGGDAYFIEECVSEKGRKTYGKGKKPGDTDNDPCIWPWSDFLRPRYPWVHHGHMYLAPGGNNGANAKIEAILKKYSK